MGAIVSGPIYPPLALVPKLKVHSDAAGDPDGFDFVSRYADYADVLEAPREVHEAVAIAMLAAVLNARVSIEYGALTPTLDLWTLILSGSGFGRNTLVGLAYPSGAVGPKGRAADNGSSL